MKTVKDSVFGICSLKKQSIGEWCVCRIGLMPCTLVLKPSFSQSLALHSHLYHPRVDLPDFTTLCLAVTGGGGIDKCGRIKPAQLSFGCAL